MAGHNVSLVRVRTGLDAAVTLRFGRACIRHEQGLLFYYSRSSQGAEAATWRWVGHGIFFTLGLGCRHLVANSAAGEAGYHNSALHIDCVVYERVKKQDGA
jgi:hypothetical protein